MEITNCKVEIDLLRERNCVLSWNGDNLNIATFQINSTKLYVPVVTLSINDNIKFVQSLKQRFKGIVSWSKHKSKITTQPRNRNLNYMINPTLRNIKRLLVLLFKNSAIDSTRDFLVTHYILPVQIKEFHTLNWQ